VNDLLLRACRLEETERRPIWFLRQAGRYLPHYEKIRRGRPLNELFKDAESAAELTALPVKLLGVDGAIVFADLLSPFEGLGLKAVYDGAGACLTGVPNIAELVSLLRKFDPNSVNFVYDTISLSRGILSDSVPVIGFAGAPYTMAVYLLGGKEKDAVPVRSLMGRTREWQVLMESLVEMLTRYVEEQVRSGARVITIFDTLVFTLSDEQFRNNVLGHTRSLILRVRGLNVPVIYCVRYPSHLLRSLKGTGANVIAVDWTVEIGDAWRELGNNIGLQGNLDPSALLGDESLMIEETTKILVLTAGRRGHIFSLGCGVHPHTPVSVLKSLVDFVKRWGA